MDVAAAAVANAAKLEAIVFSINVDVAVRYACDDTARRLLEGGGLGPRHLLCVLRGHDCGLRQRDPCAMPAPGQLGKTCDTSTRITFTEGGKSNIMM